MNETQTKVVSYWKEICIIALIIASIFFWQKWQSKATELEVYKGQHQTEETLKKVNEKLAEIVEREKNLYPKIEAEISKLNKNITDLEKIKKFYEDNKPKKETTSNEINKLKLEEISKYFFNLGYSNTIYPSAK